MRRDIDHGSFTFSTRRSLRSREDSYDYTYDNDEDHHDDDDVTKEQGGRGGQLVYKLCVRNEGPLREGIRRRVAVSLTQGTTSRDYNELARKKHVDGFLLQLEIITDTITQLGRDFDELRQRESQLLTINTHTQRRMMWSSASSCLALVVLSVFQMLYTRKLVRRRQLSWKR